MCICEMGISCAFEVAATGTVVALNAVGRCREEAQNINNLRGVCFHCSLVVRISRRILTSERVSVL